MLIPLSGLGGGLRLLMVSLGRHGSRRGEIGEGGGFGLLGGLTRFLGRLEG